MRRRQLSYPFSQIAIAQMECYFDKCLDELIDVLDEYARSGEQLDLKFWIRLYIFDVLGELAFSQSFGALRARDERVLPPIGEHVLLGSTIGQIPESCLTLLKIMRQAPIPALQRIYSSRAELADVHLNILQG
jgi:Cytochrome P450